jgi:Uma2 family endonuclease
VASRPSGWRDRHPKGKEAVLVVEIGFSSQKLDRAKAAIYARAGVEVYWVLDLAARRLEVRTDPRSDGSYAVTTVLEGRDAVSLPGLQSKVGTARKVRVSSLLP